MELETYLLKIRDIYRSYTTDDLVMEGEASLFDRIKNEFLEAIDHKEPLEEFLQRILDENVHQHVQERIKLLEQEETYLATKKTFDDQQQQANKDLELFQKRITSITAKLDTVQQQILVKKEEQMDLQKMLENLASLPSRAPYTEQLQSLQKQNAKLLKEIRAYDQQEEDLTDNLFKNQQSIISSMKALEEIQDQMPISLSEMQQISKKLNEYEGLIQSNLPILEELLEFFGYSIREKKELITEEREEEYYIDDPWHSSSNRSNPRKIKQWGTKTYRYERKTGFWLLEKSWSDNRSKFLSTPEPVSPTDWRKKIARQLEHPPQQFHQLYVHPIKQPYKFRELDINSDKYDEADADISPNGGNANPNTEEPDRKWPVSTDFRPISTFHLSFILAIRQALRYGLAQHHGTGTRYLAIGGGILAKFTFRQRSQTLIPGEWWAMMNPEYQAHQPFENSEDIYTQLGYASSSVTVSMPYGFIIIEEDVVIEITFSASPVLLATPSLAAGPHISSRAKLDDEEEERLRQEEEDFWYD